MNIFVLEDDILQQARIEEILYRLIEKHQIVTKRIEVSGKPEELLNLVDEKGNHQLFFLDIEIKKDEMKGLQVAKQIRSMDSYATIVFVTTHTEFMPLSFRYQISALDYIDKELSATDFEKRIESALLSVYQNQGRPVAEDAFYFKSKYAQVQYAFHDILYIETSPRPHRVILYTQTDRMEFTASLSDILKQEKRLLHCHRSFVINPSNVVKIDRAKRLIYFPNGAFCMVARQKLEMTLEAIAQLHH